MWQRHRSHVWYVAQAPAKLNLFLEVLGKRADNYHEIDMCVCPIEWHDTLWFRPANGGEVRFHCRWATVLPDNFSPGDLPTGPENLVCKALELLQRRTGSRYGAEVRLVKRIPSGAGLGGASSDAAAALRLANWAWGLHIPKHELQRLAAEIGSDVPLFFADGLAHCRGRGEQVTPLGYLPLHVVVVRPPMSLATAQMYRQLSLPHRPRSAEPMLRALEAGRVEEVGKLLFNRFQSLACRLSPWVERLEREFARLDLLGHAMTGSGTAYFGLCRSAYHARRVAAWLRGQGVGLVWCGRSARGLACWVEERSDGDHRSADQVSGGTGRAAESLLFDHPG
jgi:4-diphosphocytidyl-2-C-methyl-D-erythritol kinase